MGFIPPKDPWKTTTLIGRRCKPRKGCSRAILIGREASLTSPSPPQRDPGPSIRSREQHPQGVLVQQSTMLVSKTASKAAQRIWTPDTHFPWCILQEGPPVPIPNTEVKPLRAYGTAGIFRGRVGLRQGPLSETPSGTPGGVSSFMDLWKRTIEKPGGAF